MTQHTPASEPTRPLVSVVIPTLNRCRTLLETIDSVRNQRTTFPFEIVVIDNCSTDETESVLSGPGFEDITYVRHPSRISRVSNFMFAFRAARGAYVSILYDDEVMFQGNLQAKAEVLEAYPEVVAVVSSGTRREQETGKLTPGVAVRPAFCIEDRSTFLRHAFRFTTGGLPPVLMRRYAVDELSLLERDDPLDDNAFILNLSRLGSIAFLPEGYISDTMGVGEMTRNGLMEQITPRADPSVLINVPGVWFYWCQYRFRAEHVLQSDDLGLLERWLLTREARRTLRVGVWKAIYHRLMAGKHPVRLAAKVFMQGVFLNPTLVIPPVFSFFRWKVAHVDAPIPELAHTPAVVRDLAPGAVARPGVAEPGVAEPGVAEPAPDQVR